eukprot:gnl/Trimastix_PCT/4397.p1 GENE.gnl/Trimastix_PCT/4397~~gnl/Trimastix_PCT/4397.p1  ORF type:complete len:206 (+),score=25.04 gnl/Trimastix_PCT/4397:59-676(+)
MRKGRIFFNPQKYRFVKRAPQREEAFKNDLYISRETRIPILLIRAQKLLFKEGFSEVRVHGLGAAINHAVRFALQLQHMFPGVLQLHPATSTVQLFDDMEPLMEGLPAYTSTRFNSAIHIRVEKTTTALDGTFRPGLRNLPKMPELDTEAEEGEAGKTEPDECAMLLKWNQPLEEKAHETQGAAPGEDETKQETGQQNDPVPPDQ